MSSPLPAQSAAFRLTAVIPVACSVATSVATVSDGRLTVSIRRDCNTAHTVVLMGDYSESLGELTFNYNADRQTTRSDRATFVQPERFYVGVDTLVIVPSAGDVDDLQRYAESLTLAVEAA